jgi:hypothetical protein
LISISGQTRRDHQELNKGPENAYAFSEAWKLQTTNINSKNCIACMHTCTHHTHACKQTCIDNILPPYTDTDTCIDEHTSSIYRHRYMHRWTYFLHIPT